MSGPLPWQWLCLALLPALLIALALCSLGPVRQRLVGIELASSLLTLLLAACSFAFDQPSSIDVALTLALLSLPGTLVLAMFFERWL